MTISRLLRGLLLTLLCCTASSTVYCAEKVVPEDFAYGFTIEVKDDGAIYSFTIPEELYTKTRRADLGDIALFNSSGEKVPHVVRSLDTKREELERIGDVIFFPLQSTTLEKNLLSFSLSHDGGGTAIDIDSFVQENEDKEPTGYLLDFGEKRENIGSVKLYWEAETKTAVSIRLSQSEDLQHWQNVVARANLVDLQYRGQRIEQRTVQLPESLSRYVRLAFHGDSLPVMVTRIEAFKRQEQIEPETHWLALKEYQIGEVEGKTVLDFAQDYRMAVSSVQLDFAEKNSIIRASVQTRADGESWRNRCSALFYSLAINGETVRNDPCILKRAVAGKNFWRIIVHEDGAGLSEASGRASLNLGYTSDELVFLARGNPPFTLAYGSGKLENAELDNGADVVFSALGGQELRKMAHEVSLSGPVPLGGEKALLSPPAPFPWKSLLLWGILLAGVVLMLLMAVSLLRDMKKGNS